MNIPFTQTKEYLSWHEAIGERVFYKEVFEVEKYDVAEERDFQIDDEKEFKIERNVLAKFYMFPMVRSFLLSFARRGRVR